MERGCGREHRPIRIPVTGRLHRRPLLRTPMERNHLAAGASMEERDGWRIAVYEPNGELAAWAADVSHVGKLDVRGEPAEVDELTGGAETGQANHTDGVWTLRLSPTHAVVICPTRRTAGAARADRRRRDRHDVRLGRGHAGRRPRPRRLPPQLRPGRPRVALRPRPLRRRLGDAVPSIVAQRRRAVLGALRLGVRRVHVGRPARRGRAHRHRPGARPGVALREEVAA